MSRKRSLTRDDSGATAVEFALILPLLIAMIAGIIEGSRLLWTHQVLQETAAHTARCMAIGNDGCDSPAGVRVFAQARGAKLGIKFTPQAVTIAPGVTCNDIDKMNRVEIDIPFNSPFEGIIPGLPERLNAKACFPNLT